MWTLRKKRRRVNATVNHKKTNQKGSHFALGDKSSELTKSLSEDDRRFSAACTSAGGPSMMILSLSSKNSMCTYTKARIMSN